MYLVKTLRYQFLTCGGQQVSSFFLVFKGALGKTIIFLLLHV